ncbi:MAG: hypothetical protein WDN67_05285 [Candidatus Moraniibacteriota bacterium]
MGHFFEKRYRSLSVTTWLFLVLALVTYLGFGLYHLGKFQTADEDLWFANLSTGRVHQYFAAWENHDWKHTRVNDKPGVTTALLSGSLGLLVDTNPEAKQTKIDNGPLRVYDAPLNEKTSFYLPPADTDCQCAPHPLPLLCALSVYA